MAGLESKKAKQQGKNAIYGKVYMLSKNKSRGMKEKEGTVARR